MDIICWFPAVENETVTLFPPTHLPAHGGCPPCPQCHVTSRRLQTGKTLHDRTTWQRLPFFTAQLSLSLEVIVVFCNLLSFLLSLRSSVFFASSRMPAQCIQERQNLYQLHLREEITADSLWASLVPRHPGSLFTVLPGTPSPVSCFLRSPVPVSSLLGSGPRGRVRRRL